MKMKSSKTTDAKRIKLNTLVMFVTLQMGFVLLNFTELDQFLATHSPLLMINSRGNVTSCFTTWDLLVNLLPFVTEDEHATNI